MKEKLSLTTSFQKKSGIYLDFNFVQIHPVEAE